MARHCLALDLQDDSALIQEYKRQHERIWPEIRHHLTAAGVLDMQIYLLGTRLFMVMDVSPAFTFDAMAALAAANPKVQEWEDLMWRFQAPTPWTPRVTSGSSWSASSTSPHSPTRNDWCSEHLALQLSDASEKLGLQSSE